MNVLSGSHGTLPFDDTAFGHPADWIIDLGPEGGDLGGRMVAEGTPGQIAAAPGSYTGQYLSR